MIDLPDGRPWCLSESLQKQKHQPSDRRLLVASAERPTQTFLFDRIGANLPVTNQRIHITGCPRSGTTLLVEMMRTCFVCHNFAEHETSLLRPVPDFDGLLITKQPGETFLLPRLLALDPNLGAIHIIRDPRSVLSSKHADAPDLYATHFGLWRESRNAAESLRGHPRFLPLRYEDLVSDPDAVQENIGNFFPALSRRRNFSDFHNFATASGDALAALNGLRPVSAVGIAAWQRHLPRIKQQVAEHPDLLDALVECGYEPDRSWVSQLDNVPREQHRCWLPERVHIFKRLDRWLRRERKIRNYARALRRGNR
jgi:hypothetical protein